MAQLPHLDALLAFKINDAHAFCTSPEDLHQSSLEQVHALTVTLGKAFAECQEMALVNPDIMRHGFDALGVLVGLAALAKTGEQA